MRVWYIWDGWHLILTYILYTYLLIYKPCIRTMKDISYVKTQKSMFFLRVWSMVSLVCFTQEHYQQTGQHICHSAPLIGSWYNWLLNIPIYRTFANADLVVCVKRFTSLTYNFFFYARKILMIMHRFNGYGSQTS